MLARIRKSMEDKDQGFTLIELLVVIVIIGILAAIAIPTFLNQRKKGWDSAAKSDVRNMQIAAETAFVDAQKYPLATAFVAGTDYKTSAPSVTGHAYNTNGTVQDKYCVQATSQSTVTWAASSEASGVAKGTCAAGAFVPAP